MDSYLKYWGVMKPFFTRPESDEQIFGCQELVELRDQLLHSVESIGDISMVVSPPSGGKTTLIKWLYHQLPYKDWEVITIHLVEEHTSHDWLVIKLANFFGVPSNLEQQVQYREILRRMDEVADEGRKFLILVDNAHFLKTPAAFVGLKQLHDLQKLSKKSTHISLFGHPELMDVVNKSTTLLALVQTQIQVGTLTVEGLREIYANRFEALNIENPFTPEATQKILESAEYVLGIAMSYSEKCMIHAALSEKTLIDPDLVEKAISKSKNQGTTYQKTAKKVSKEEINEEIASLDSLFKKSS